MNIIIIDDSLKQIKIIQNKTFNGFVKTLIYQGPQKSVYSSNSRWLFGQFFI